MDKKLFRLGWINFWITSRTPIHQWLMANLPTLRYSEIKLTLLLNERYGIHMYSVRDFSIIVYRHLLALYVSYELCIYTCSFVCAYTKHGIGLCPLLFVHVSTGVMLYTECMSMILSNSHLCYLHMRITQLSIEEAQRTIDREMKARGVEYLFYETSAHTGENLDEFKKQFGTCLAHTRVYLHYCGHLHM